MRRTLYLAVVLIALLLFAVPVQAGEETGEKTLWWPEHHAVEINNTDGKQLDINYDVLVTDGVNVNIYFMDASNYAKFISFQNFTYYGTQSTKDTADANKHWKWTREGTFYIVIETAGVQSIDITTYEYDISWDEGGSVWWGLPILWCLIILVIIGVIGIATIWLVMQALRARRESTAEGTRGEGGSGGPPPGEGTGGMSPEPTPPVTEVHTSTIPPPGEGAAELGPQPEPPDSPVGTPSDSGYRGTAEPPAPGTTTIPAEPMFTGEGVTELSPQPEPPDMPAHATVSPPGEGVAELSPQPEPPDMPAHATVSPPGEGVAELSPQPEPPDLEARGDGRTKLGPQPEPPD